MPEAEHQRLIREAAKRHLAPLGLRQRGRSRCWIDDHGWWLITVEFQPSSWSKGSYLNVGAMWLWRPIDALTFEYGSRVGGFSKFSNPVEFVGAVDSLAASAAAEVVRIRAALGGTIDSVARSLATWIGADSPWQRMHVALALALSRHSAQSAAILRALSVAAPDDPPWPWLKELRQRSHELATEVEHPEQLASSLTSVVRASRVSLGLPVWDGSVPTVAA
jgi:hypothetical protein